MLLAARPRGMMIVTVAIGLAGCYAYTPLVSAPVPGTRVALSINDRGRVALEQHMGLEVASVEGVLSEQNGDSQLVINVMTVTDLRGERSHWAGESVVFRPEYVREMRQRRFSGGRTVALVSVLASGGIAFVASRGLLGGGSGDSGGPGGITPPPAH